MEESGASARGCRKTTRILAVPFRPLQASSVCHHVLVGGDAVAWL